MDDEALPYAEEDFDCPEKLNLIKECNLTFPSPWKHARAKEEKTRKNITQMARILS